MAILILEEKNTTAALTEVGQHYSACLRAVQMTASRTYSYWVQYGGKKHRKERTVRLWRLESGPSFVFPAGLAGELASALRKTGAPFRLDDRRQKPSNGVIPFPKNKLPELWPHQQEAREKMLAAGRGVVQLPPGGGKTVLAAALISEVGQTALFLVPNLELLHQTLVVFRGLFGPRLVGAYGGGEKRPAPLTVATAQALWKGRDEAAVKRLLQEAGVLILDEVHHVGGGYRLKATWYELAQHCSAWWRFGLSATPGEPGSPERMFVTAATGRTIYRVLEGELVRAQVLQRPTIYFVEYDHRRSRLWRWEEAREALHGDPARNGLVAGVARSYAAQGKKVLVVVDRTEKHGHTLARMMPEALYVTGSSPQRWRQAAVRAFRDGGGGILLGTVFGEGFDVRDLDVVVIAAGGKSSRLAVQRLGRVLRTAEGKRSAVCVDIRDVDGCLIWDQTGTKVYRPGPLERHAAARRRAYERQGFEVQVLKPKEKRR